MSLITAVGLSKSFGQVDIFSKISLSIPHRARVAIVGPNGIGKTTLLRILAGYEEASAGTVTRARSLQIGYLPQEAGFDATHTLWEECLKPFAKLREQEAELAQLEADMADPAQAETVLARYGKLQAEFDHAGGYTYVSRIQQVLGGLGFKTDEFHYPLPHLSGGQRTRALLARLLLSEPDLLILDEPTNHLDIEAVEWLEGHLSQWKGATLIVSHDRYFLDRVVNTIWEMTRAGFEVYHGTYTAYVQTRQERWDHRQEIFDAEKERLLKEMEYIKRNISGQNVTQARGRLRRLTRRLQAIEQVGIEAVTSKAWGELSEEVDTTTSLMGVEEAERRVRALSLPSSRPPHLHLNLRADLRSGELVLRTYDLKVGYPGNLLFTAPDIELRRLECAALIGPNGAGKTTFLKTILEKIPPLDGDVMLGASLNVGYFAQAHEDLLPERTLAQEIDAVAPQMLLSDIRRYLARFLFTGDDVFKPVSVLSGGERGRLALAKLALTGANLLLLDEPTNHLDIPSQEVLQEVLADFAGTILLVSHDRYLIDALATQVWEIDEPQGALRVFNGSYSQYKAEQEAARESARLAESQSKSKVTLQKTGLSLDEKRRRKRLKEVEGLIAGLEDEQAVLARKLENPPADPVKVQKLGSEYMRVQKELDQLMEEWGELQEMSAPE
ncbi:MAG TPA: ABC-F family ATP-binding cassette domain-containing protein [Anaerolineales bacterium]|nr:ABC-F family ATP-binding cassette domain-containing protein [Anaerolineales bacterium]